jgi:D-beta-D-heptose 7-phosphate kinase/D-beta-D-heptose 1-phosphate adenosyltransferase
MSLFDRSGVVVTVPTQAQKVADVSGAGDTVIAALTLALAGGATLHEAALLANHAAGVVVAEVGIVPIEPAALLHSIAG